MPERIPFRGSSGLCGHADDINATYSTGFPAILSSIFAGPEEKTENIMIGKELQTLGRTLTAELRRRLFVEMRSEITK